MSIGMQEADWQYIKNKFLEDHKASYYNNYYSNYGSSTTGSEALVSNTANENNCDTVELSYGNNTCTDGEDDGKINPLVAAGNILEGAGKSFVGIFTNAIKHPFKTAAVMGACCIPVIGPAIGGYLAARGICSGVKTLVNGIKVANSATTDAQAKAAFENIGGGTFTTAASVVALKGSMGVMKKQIANSETVGLIKNYKSGDLGEVLAKGAQETLDNIGAVTKTVADKGKGAFDYVKDIFEQKKSPAQVGTELAATFKTKAVDCARNTGEKIENTINNTKKFLSEGKNKITETFKSNSGTKATPPSVETIKTNMTQKGYTLKEAQGNSGDLVWEKTNGGEVQTVVYNKKGFKTSETIVDNNVTTQRTYNSSGKLIKETKTAVDETGGSPITETNTTTYDKNGEVKVTSEETVIKNSDDSLESRSYKETKGNITKEEVEGPDYKTTTKTKEANGYKISKTKETTGNKTKTTTNYSKNGEIIEGRMAKAWAKYKATAVSPTVDKFIETQIKEGNLTVWDLALWNNAAQDL